MVGGLFIPTSFLEGIPHSIANILPFGSSPRLHRCSSSIESMHTPWLHMGALDILLDFVCSLTNLAE